MMTHDEMIAVIAAHRDGKKVQFCEKSQKNWSNVIDTPIWNFKAYDYRIKPEPLVLWVVWNETQKYVSSTENTKVEAEIEKESLEAANREYFYTLKKFVEVTE